MCPRQSTAICARSQQSRYETPRDGSLMRCDPRPASPTSPILAHLQDAICREFQLLIASDAGRDLAGLHDFDGDVVDVFRNRSAEPLASMLDIDLNHGHAGV